jgi:hypothetical protein
MGALAHLLVHSVLMADKVLHRLGWPKVPESGLLAHVEPQRHIGMLHHRLHAQANGHPHAVQNGEIALSCCVTKMSHAEPGARAAKNREAAGTILSEGTEDTGPSRFCSCTPDFGRVVCSQISTYLADACSP